MVQLNQRAFNSFLQQMGQQFLWRKAYACPCLSHHSGQAKINCRQCFGRGRVWAEGEEGSAGVVTHAQTKRQAAFGIWDEGDIALSIPADSVLYNMGQYDRVLCLNRTEPFSITLTYGVNDTLRFIPTVIERVTWLDEAEHLVEGEVPFVGAQGELLWDDVTPPVKASYALTGRRSPEYFCYQDMPLDRPHHAGELLPRRVQLRRFEL